MNAQLAAAIQALPAMAGFIVPSLPTFSDDLYGYIQAVNYLVRQFAPDVAFGWQTNVWATGTADWVLRDTADPVAEGQAIADLFMNWAFTAENMRRTLLRLINLSVTVSVLMRLPTMAGMRHAGLITWRWSNR